MKTTKSNKKLIYILIVLVIIILALSIYAVGLKKESNSKSSDITIPLLEEKTENTISIDLSTMRKYDKKEYIFKVTNYRKNKLSPKELQYKIEIQAPSSISLKLYKNDFTEDLLENNSYLIDKNVLRKGKKIIDEYHLVIRINSDISPKDQINIKITS